MSLDSPMIYAVWFLFEKNNNNEKTVDVGAEAEVEVKCGKPFKVFNQSERNKRDKWNGHGSETRNMLAHSTQKSIQSNLL